MTTAEFQSISSSEHNQLLSDVTPKKRKRAPNKPIPQPTQRQIENFWSFVDVRGPNECWRWRGAKILSSPYCPDKFYGQFRIGKSMFKAHRVAYTLVRGPIRDGYTLDHVLAWGCTDSLCVNPNHLQEATMAEQASRRRPRKPTKAPATSLPAPQHNTGAALSLPLGDFVECR